MTSDPVFLDTQVYVSVVFNYHSTEFAALRTRVKNGQLKLVTTDVTAREIETRIAEVVATVAEGHRGFVSRSSILKGSESGKAFLHAFNADSVTSELIAGFRAFLKDTNTLVLSTRSMAVGEIFDRYFEQRPPFGGARDKRSEFPDAVVLQRLKEWALEEGVDLTVVTRDSLFLKAASEAGFSSQETLGGLLDMLASSDTALASFVREQTLRHSDAITEIIADDFSGVVLFELADRDGEVRDVEVVSVMMPSEPDILYLNKGNAALRFELSVEARVEAVYAEPDSEDDDSEQVYWRNRWLRQDTTVVAELTVKFTGMEVASFEIESVTIIEPRGTVRVWIQR